MYLFYFQIKNGDNHFIFTIKLISSSLTQLFMIQKYTAFSLTKYKASSNLKTIQKFLCDGKKEGYIKY